MTSLGDGQVEITIDGEPRYLTPTPKAAFELSRLFGGLGGLDRRLALLDLDAYVTTVRIGLGLDERHTLFLEEAIYKIGMSEDLLYRPVGKFLAILQNGGRPLDLRPDEKGEAGGV